MSRGKCPYHLYSKYYCTFTLCLGISLVQFFFIHACVVTMIWYHQSELLLLCGSSWTVVCTVNVSQTPRCWQMFNHWSNTLYGRLRIYEHYSSSLLFFVHELGGFAFSCTPNLITNLPLSPIAWNWSIIDQYLPKLHKMDHLFLWICYLRLIAVMTERWVTQFCSLFHTGELNQHKRILVYISQ